MDIIPSIYTKFNLNTQNQWFLFWWNFIKFQPAKYDFDLYTGFFMERLAQIHQISKENNAKATDFKDKLQ
jgi:hypothetical protein